MGDFVNEDFSLALDRMQRSVGGRPAAYHLRRLSLRLEGPDPELDETLPDQVWSHLIQLVQSCTSLRELSLEIEELAIDHHDLSTALEALPKQTLRSLSITGQDNVTARVLVCLVVRACASLPALQRLAIDCVDWSDTEDDSIAEYALDACTALAVRSLSIQCGGESTWIAAVLPSLSIPGLQQLEISEERDSQPDEIIPFLTVHGPNLLALEAGIIISRDTLHSVSRVLRLCPNLEDLFVVVNDVDFTVADLEVPLLNIRRLGFEWGGGPSEYFEKLYVFFAETCVRAFPGLKVIRWLNEFVDDSDMEMLLTVAQPMLAYRDFPRRHGWPSAGLADV